ncbi:hypothetical protein C7974DRAFT_112613 [Boeremia exigua]|uniref:uncharacterized protein n=1 Tax=Boeremia exigua TaxID=749465 RepID=UPI001E8DBAEB|nr:uncharacterized protein C7974DRAFT_112613 [Boeremia exigua]KAH6642908.1 hypothetical protein C7974DRAFT_112613 [Boeremia exigua]
MKTLPAHADTPLGSRPRPLEARIQVVMKVFRDGNFHTARGKLLTKIDDAVQGKVGKMRDDKALIIAKLVEELKAKLAIDGDDEACFIEKAQQFLKLDDSTAWRKYCFGFSMKGSCLQDTVRNWFYEASSDTGPARAATKTAVENANKPTVKPPSGTQGRVRDTTVESPASQSNQGPQHKHRQYSQSEGLQRLSQMPPVADSVGLTPGTSAMMYSSSSAAAHPRVRRASDSATLWSRIAAMSPCPRCGRPWHAHEPVVTDVSTTAREAALIAQYNSVVGQGAASGRDQVELTESTGGIGNFPGGYLRVGLIPETHIVQEIVVRHAVVVPQPVRQETHHFYHIPLLDCVFCALMFLAFLLASAYLLEGLVGASK